MNVLSLIKKGKIADTEYKVLSKDIIERNPVLAEIMATELEINKEQPPVGIPVPIIFMLSFIGAFVSIVVLFPLVSGGSAVLAITDFTSFLFLIGIPLGIPFLMIAGNIIAFIMAKAPPRAFYFPYMSISAVAEAINEKDKDKTMLERTNHFITVSKNTETLGAYLVDCRREHPGIFISADDLEEGLRNVGGGI